MRAEKSLESRRIATLSAQPVVSCGSERIVASMPGREAPVEDRLFAVAEEKREKQFMLSMMTDSDERTPAICETSRRIAEKANAGVSLESRLASKTGSCPSRPAAVPTEMVECYHAPSINQKSERMAIQMQARSWANGQVTVEDRLIASIVQREEEPVVEQKPEINPNSERILARRGPIAPLQDRLAQKIGTHVRSGIGSELEQCTLAPTISERSRQLSQRSGREGSVIDRLNAWGKQHQRGEGDSSLADRKFRFGPDPEAPPAPPPPVPPPLIVSGAAPLSDRAPRKFDSVDAPAEKGRRPSGDGTWRISDESEMRRTSNGRSATSSDATDDTDLVGDAGGGAASRSRRPDGLGGAARPGVAPGSTSGETAPPAMSVSTAPRDWR